MTTVRDEEKKKKEREIFLRFVYRLFFAKNERKRAGDENKTTETFMKKKEGWVRGNVGF
jgi:hypothetical protein